MLLQQLDMNYFNLRKPVLWHYFVVHLHWRVQMVVFVWRHWLKRRSVAANFLFQEDDVSVRDMSWSSIIFEQVALKYVKPSGELIAIFSDLFSKFLDLSQKVIVFIFSFTFDSVNVFLRVWNNSIQIKLGSVKIFTSYLFQSFVKFNPFIVVLYQVLEFSGLIHRFDKILMRQLLYKWATSSVLFLMLLESGRFGLNWLHRSINSLHCLLDQSHQALKFLSLVWGCWNDLI